MLPNFLLAKNHSEEFVAGFSENRVLSGLQTKESCMRIAYKQRTRLAVICRILVRSFYYLLVRFLFDTVNSFVTFR